MFNSKAQNFKFSLHKLETVFPSNPRWQDWKGLGSETILAPSIESAARQIFAANSEVDRIMLENKNLEEPIYFDKSDFAIHNPENRW